PSEAEQGHAAETSSNAWPGYTLVGFVGATNEGVFRVPLLAALLALRNRAEAAWKNFEQGWGAAPGTTSTPAWLAPPSRNRRCPRTGRTGFRPPLVPGGLRPRRRQGLNGERNQAWATAWGGAGKGEPLTGDGRAGMRKAEQWSGRAGEGRMTWRVEAGASRWESG